MRLIGLSYRIVVSDVEENAPDNLSPGEFVRYLAHVKAEAVYKTYPECCVIGADTIVNIDGEVIGKPKDAEDAKRILHKLQGRTHVVHTGLAVRKSGYTAVEQEETRVTFAPMTDEEIDWYVKTGEPLDKAGAYGIQGPGGILGDAAFFQHGVYRHSIRCIVPCTGVALSRKLVQEEVLPRQALSLYLLRNLAAKSYMMSSQLEAASFMDSEQQLAHFLWHLGQEQEKDSAVYRNMAGLSLGGLGEMLGMHRVTVTKIMSAWKKEGIVVATPLLRVNNMNERERRFTGH